MSERRDDAMIESIRARVNAPTSFGYGITHYKNDCLDLLDTVDALLAEVREKDERIKELEPDAWKIEATINMAVADLKAEVARLREALEAHDCDGIQACRACDTLRGSGEGE